MSVAGPSLFPPPPECMQPDDRSAADRARSRLSKRRSFLDISFPGFSPRNSIYKKGKQDSVDDTYHYDRDGPQNYPEPGLQSPSIFAPEIPEPTFVELDDDFVYVKVELDEDYDKDVYRWAVLYENQRGVTVFSTPYYSPLSLLPMDPPPFTIPTDSPSPRAGQPTVSLSSYTLPDGTWRWVSRTWMVDMRGDCETQYDGFEYNWSFRGKKWRAQVGHLNAGGWVRRRRWVRLMMRPAKAGKLGSAPSSGKSTPGDIPHHDHSNSGATRPPSIALPADDATDEGMVWRGVVEEDWMRCHMALKRLGRDGRKLELWAHWLNPSPVDPIAAGDKGKGKATESEVSSSRSTPIRDDTLAEEIGANIDPVPQGYVAAVLRSHGTEIIQSFIYPDSRAQFVELLSRSNLLADLRRCTNRCSDLQALDFWSYATGLDNTTNVGIRDEA